MQHYLDEVWGTYHGPHKLWIIAGGPHITINFIRKCYLYLTTCDRVFLRHTILRDRGFGLTVWVPAYHGACFSRNLVR